MQLKSRLFGAALACGLAMWSTAGAATTISFDGGADQCVANGSRCMMLQTFGDTAAVDVSYQNVRPDGTVVGAAQQFYANYGDLGKVLTAGSYLDGTLGQVTIKARDGYRISLLDFDFVGYVNFAPTLPLKVLDLLGNELVGGVYSTGSGSTHSSLAVNSAFLDGIVIRWGPDASVGGIDNIRYEVQGAVPEPATWAMMILGFGGVGALLRHRRMNPLAAMA
ncbi:PEPxxWA-CTERM sorting domain-containing protein [Phenylobacterium kunshanense]|nr:PEPxxWA-CTERM sorting domain-containing protein [Phenylobacterium kunshanense]